MIIGAGYIGTVLRQQLRERGDAAELTSRRAGHDHLIESGADLDRLLAKESFDQVVLTAQLTGEDIDWLLDRVDGPRWVVMSSAQLGATVSAPGLELARVREEVALARGALVLRPTMVFGHGGDKNVTALVRFIRRYRTVVQIGTGEQLVQPLHVDDLAQLVYCHCQSPSAGLFAVAGAEALTVRELNQSIVELLGIRTLDVRIPMRALEATASFARLAGLRADQVRRLVEDKTVDTRPVRRQFSWEPAPVGIRLEQAVRESRGLESLGPHAR